MRNGRCDDLRLLQTRRDRSLGIVLVDAIVTLLLRAATGWVGDGPLPLVYPEKDNLERWIR
jgi:hypothetical protein